MATIAKILGVEVVRYRDNGQTVAYVRWQDSRGRAGTTSGSPKNLHMRALLARAKREQEG